MSMCWWQHAGFWCTRTQFN